MRGVSVALIGWLAAVAVAGDDKPTTKTFARSDDGKLPAGWTAAKTGTGEGSVWKVAADPTGPGGTGFVLTQTAAGPNGLFNLCVLDDFSFKDGEVSVSVKGLAGKLDQGGGVVWRYQDANNYYVCRYNPLEKNFRVYYVKAGKRTQLATKEDLDVPAGEWFTVSVRQTGNKIECALNGKGHLSVTDETFKEAGKVGVWCKADAVSAFDRLTFSPAGK